MADFFSSTGQMSSRSGTQQQQQQIPAAFVEELDDDDAGIATGPADHAGAARRPREWEEERVDQKEHRTHRHVDDDDDDDDDDGDEDDEDDDDNDDDDEDDDRSAARKPGGKRQFLDITEYLCLPQSDAAVKLGLPVSTLSKRWKEAARNRKWPFRKVSKLDKEIAMLLRAVPQTGEDAGLVPGDIEQQLGALLRIRQEELKTVVIRL